MHNERCTSGLEGGPEKPIGVSRQGASVRPYREGYPPGGTRPRSGLGRVARSRSDAPKPIADSATSVLIADSIDALEILIVVLFVTGIIVVAVIATRTMVLTGIAAIVVLRRALSPIASTARTWMPGLTTA